MPTDPFVPPDPSARPRQQQNLPPGVALPPATRWTADRPGELGPAQPDGALFGNPGPNVGYAYTLAQRVKDRVKLTPAEHTDDVLAVVAEIAGKRAAMFGRAPVIGDIDIAVTLLGYDGAVDGDFATARAALVNEAAHIYRRRRVIVDAVPESILRGKAADVKADAPAWRASLQQLAKPEAARGSV